MPAAEEKQWDQLREVTLGYLNNFFRANGQTPDELARAKLATAVLGAYTRHEQSEKAHIATVAVMARDLAENVDQRRLYIAATLPKHPMILAMRKSLALTEGEHDTT